MKACTRELRPSKCGLDLYWNLCLANSPNPAICMYSVALNDLDQLQRFSLFEKRLKHSAFNIRSLRVRWFCDWCLLWPRHVKTLYGLTDSGSGVFHVDEFIRVLTRHTI